ncbi:MAG: DJ-1/PfpI family protein [Treponema sp.]|jgi:4-methyl-5(b-hydroxyethyl)-thiazole monophosphate biosynthesis|nr:DJ-1/PfpI family protein [Treponema sp.]
MAKKVVVLLADGFEEVEAVTPVDYLRRAGLEVTCAAIGKGKLVTGAHGIPINADTLLSELGDRGAAFWDAVVLPGGMPGASNLAASAVAGKFLKDMAAAGKVVAAICASPALVLAPLGLLAGRRFTCFPGMEKQVDLSLNQGGRWSEDRVVVDGSIVTSRGAGTAGVFAVALIGLLLGEEEGKGIARTVLL